MIFWLLILAALAICPVALAGAGSLDPTFDGDGRVTTDLGGLDAATAVVVQADGKIVAVGTSPAGNVLVRYESTGALDTTFEGDGIVLFAGPPPADVAAQDDGKVVVAGSWGVARFNADGTLDMSFAGDGIATKRAFAGDFNGVAVQPDGKVVVVGRSYRQSEGGTAGIVRFNSDGTIDRSFSGDGMLLMLKGYYSAANAVSIRPNGKIVVAGWEYTEVNDMGRTFSLYRVRPGGTLDKSFGGDGIVRTSFGDDGAEAFDVALQADGRIVVVGYTGFRAAGDFALARYTKGGRLDATLSDDGKRRTDFGGGRDEARGLMIQANGRIVLAGSAAPPGHRLQANFALARYRASGELDRTFSDNGKKRTRFGANNQDSGNDLTLQPDGRIVVAGSATLVFDSYDFGLARYLAE